MGEESLSINSITYQHGCCFRLRRSNRLIVLVNLLVMIAGIMVVSVLQPILPDVLDKMYERSYKPHETTVAPELATNASWPTDSPAKHSTFPQKALIIGSLLGFAPLIEIFFTPVAVVAIRYLGFKTPMIAACVLQLFGCYAIAYADVLVLLYAARITQAISVIFATVAGFSMIAIRFTDDAERSNALATAMQGFPIGILVAYPCGTAIYSHFGLTMPFVMISGISIIATVFVLLIKETDDDRRRQSQDSQSGGYLKLLSNKSILLSLMLIMYSWGVVFMLGATTPNRMSTILHAKAWEIGLVLFVSTLVQIITSAIVGKLAGKVDRWAVTFVGNLACIIGLVAYPWCNNIYWTIGPESVVRMGWGMVTSSMGPLLGTLVDQNHGTAYIRVYALFMSFNLFGAFAGSLLGGWLDGSIGFDMLFWSSSVLTFIVSIVGFALSRCLSVSEETELNDTFNDIASEYCPILDSASTTPTSNGHGRHRHFSTSYQYQIGVA